MSAREDLIRSVYALKNMSQNDMEKLVDAFAHELAAKIRANVDMGGADLADAADAADFIDPEVLDG